MYFDNSKKVETTSGGLNVTGITTFSDRINVVSGVSTFQDNAKLTFGAQSDLIVYHSGSHSFIQDTTGTGNLYIDSNSLQIRNAAGDETQAVFAENGAVELYYDDSKKVETTSGGLNVTGITTISDRLQVTSGISTFYDTTQSTSATTGAVIINGGVGNDQITGNGGNDDITGGEVNVAPKGSSGAPIEPKGSTLDTADEEGSVGTAGSSAAPFETLAKGSAKGSSVIGAYCAALGGSSNSSILLVSTTDVCCVSIKTDAGSGVAMDAM